MVMLYCISVYNSNSLPKENIEVQDKAEYGFHHDRGGDVR